MVYVLTIFLQNIKIQYHVVLQVCKYFFSQDYVLPIHQLTFRKTQAITGSLVVHGSICSTGISVEQDWNTYQNDKLRTSCEENPRLEHIRDTLMD